MKTLKITVLLFLTQFTFSQDKPCEYEIDVATDTSSTRVLKDRIIDESVFGTTTSFLTFKLKSLAYFFFYFILIRLISFFWLNAL